MRELERMRHLVVSCARDLYRAHCEQAQARSMLTVAKVGTPEIGTAIERLDRADAGVRFAVTVLGENIEALDRVQAQIDAELLDAPAGCAACAEPFHADSGVFAWSHDDRFAYCSSRCVCVHQGLSS